MRRLGPLFLFLAGGGLVPVALWTAPAASPPDAQAPPSGVSEKPSPPIDLEARIEGDPLRPFGIVASASSRTGHEVELEVVLPPGVLHRAGDRLVRGMRCLLRADLETDGRGRREIFVRASIHEGSATQTRVLSLVLGDAASAPPGHPTRNARGEAILEFKP
jgi:hypothetical protein